MSRNRSRILTAAGAAVVGALVGVQMMFVAQDIGSKPDTAGPSTTAPLAESAADASSRTRPSPPRPRPPAPTPQSGRAAVEPAILLAWTRTTLDPALKPAGRAYSDVTSVSVVRGAITNLVASRDAEGRLVQQPEDGWMVPLDTIAVDATAHDDFAPLADRSAVAGLREGEALLGRTSAQLRGIGPGGSLDLADGTRLVVAGIVDDTTIGAAELAVTRETGAEIGVDNPRYLLLAHDGDRAAVEAALRGALPPGTAVRFRAPGETPYLRQSDAVLPPVRLKELFGEFAYRPPPEGEREFAQDPAWQSEYLVERDLPIIGPARCHRDVVDAVEGALAELEAANLAGLVDPAGFAGCWNPRLVQPGGDLSHHAWGVALDVNYRANPTCQESVQDARLVDAMDRWGFTWGGGWLCPDPAHFEFLAPPTGS